MHVLRNEGGSTVVFELVLGVVVLSIIGLASLQYYRSGRPVAARRPSATPQSSVGPTEPNGTVANSTNALIKDAQADQAALSTESDLVVPSDSTNQSALSLKDAYDPGSF